MSTLTGTARSPIIVRVVPGERATIDGRLSVFGADAVYWGLELMQSDPLANGQHALDASGPSKKRSEEHTSELRHGYISHAVFCLKKKIQNVIVAAPGVVPQPDVVA